jgi:hypothetical protein
MRGVAEVSVNQMHETGLKHDWFFPHLSGYPNLGPYESCRLCGIVKNRKNVDATTCRGLVRVTLR